MTQLRVLLFVFSLTFVYSGTLLASLPPGPLPQLSESERNSLRYHLENNFNSVDLIIKNNRANLADLKRQEKDIEALKIFERIPLRRDIVGLKKNLQQSLQDHHLKFLDFRIRKFSKPAPLPPKKVDLGGHPFQLKPDQLAEFIYFETQVQGEKSEVKKWVQSWQTDQMRLVELDSPDESQSIRAIQPNQWIIQAHGFRFRDIQFPKLVPKNPRTLLPSWAQKNLQLFAKAEPLLWTFVNRTETLIPRTPPYFEVKEKFLLNDARMNFFFSKAMPRK